MMNTTIQWKTMVEAHPIPTVQAICFARVGGVLSVVILHRSANVRSVPNVWSFPGGLWDIGEDMEKAAARELFEELNLQAAWTTRGVMGIQHRELGCYNSIPGDGWHWLNHPIALWCSRPNDLVNNELDKHDQVAWHPVSALTDPAWWDRYKFAQSFEAYALGAHTRGLERMLKAAVELSMEVFRG